jgi:L-lysine 6-transaminase
VFDWPRIDVPAIRFPLDDPQNLAAVVAAEERALEQARAAFAAHPHDIACFIAEPIQGEGGDNHMRPEFLQAMQDLCRAHDALFVLDEVQTGGGMTGTPWAYQQLGLHPDVVAFGKKLQVCGIMAGGRVDEVPDNVFRVPSRINSTWGGNLTDMVRAQRYFEIIDEENLVENTARVGAYFVGELDRFQQEFPSLVSNVRGRGLMAAFDLPSGDIRDAALKSFMAHDVMALSSGARSARFRPPLNLSMEEAAEGIRRMEKALKDLA